MYRIILIAVLFFAFVPSSIVHADPPDCNDPSDNGPLVPGDCGYEDGVMGDGPTVPEVTGEERQTFFVYLPAVVGGGPDNVQVWFLMYRDINGNGSFDANESVSPNNLLRMLVTGETGQTLAPVIGQDGMTVRSFTYRVGEELFIQAQELDQCSGWDGIGFLTVPNHDVIALLGMHPYDNC